MEKLTQKINQLISKVFGEKVEVSIEFPPKIELGDLTINCFGLARDLHKNPQEIAKEIGESIGEMPEIEKAEATGAYLNLTLKNAALFELIANPEKGETKEKVMVEYLQPNTNKPLHLGHVRNGCLGMAMSNILAANDHEVIKANLINDRGIHICKSMLAWLKWGEGDTPQSTGMKGDHFVGMWYVKFALESENDPNLENEARELLQKWEANDEKTLEVWKKMNGWVIKGFGETNKNFGFKFDHEYFESETYKVGKEIIQEGLKKGIFYKDKDGAVVVDLPKEEFGLDKDNKTKKVTLQRADGTSLYMTQDLGTAKLKFDEFKIDRSIYVVGSEQEYHFKCLFAILEMLGYPFAKNCYHLSYGMVYLPDGKMKSREGKVVDADELLTEMEKLAAEEIAKRLGETKLDKEEIEKRAHVIGLGAIKFYLLKTSARNDIYFNPEESISFDGFTGPYCQYAYARATKILTKSGCDWKTADLAVLGNDEERLIAQKMIILSLQTKTAADEKNPMKVAVAVYDLAVAFNQFYQKHPVLNAEDEKVKIARLSLVDATRKAIKEGLGLLGIDVLEEM